MSEAQQRGSAARAEGRGSGAQPSGPPTADPGKQFRREVGLPVVPALDGFRAYAIGGIVLLHMMAVFLLPLSNAERFVTYGVLPNLVDILFILSGFVVFLPTVARGGQFGRVSFYAIRRVARLMPAFWLAIVITVALVAIWPASPAPATASPFEVLVHATALHRPAELFDPDFAQGLSINGPMWTLSLEMTFYVLLPLVAASYFRHPLIGLGLALAITVGWKLGAENITAIAELLGIDASRERLITARLSAIGQFPAWLFHFALGMTSAWAYVRLRERYEPAWLAKRAVWIGAAALLALVPLLAAFGSYTEETAVIAPTIARGNIALAAAIPVAISTFMLATALGPIRLQTPFAAPRVRRLGDISYGIYLIHFPIILYVGTLVANSDSALAGALDNFPALMAITVVLAVAYGYLSARYLELPVRRWAHRFGRRATAVEPGAEITSPGAGRG